ncbi:hypothetical protein, partial [Nonomuraea deserti]|uniref:hypothetical protein n=1 Tax=Nonomuraea deserti TaxID=1848322 RepID=UPI001C6FFF1A
MPFPRARAAVEGRGPLGGCVVDDGRPAGRGPPPGRAAVEGRSPPAAGGFSTEEGGVEAVP